MTLRTRLTVMVLTLVFGAAIVMAVASYGVVRSQTYLVADKALAHAVDHLKGRDEGSGLQTSSAEAGESGFLMASGAYYPNGTFVWFHWAGFDPGQYPLPVPTTGDVHRALQGPVTINNPVPYRLQALDGMYDPAGARVTALFAFPVADEREHLQKVAVALGIGVILVSLIGAFLAWLLVRRSLTPVDSMIEVAGDIAQGDLDRRVPEMKEGTELGALAHSLNTMIASMQSSIHEREESEMTMRRFLGDASHELRTPLTVIRGYAELLGNEQVLNEAQRTRAIQRLDTESTRMETLVLDLLNLARLDEHRPLSIKPVDIAQLTRDALDDLRLQQPSREITVTAPSSAIVRGDETRLRQVMANLVGNIRSYTPDDSAVNATITIADNQKWHDASVDVVLTLDDSGPGIPADQYELARQRFGRLDVSRARSTGGFGLGLSIVDAVVQAHDGDFSLSESPTRGLRVTVRLPIDGPDVVEDDTDVLRPDAKPSDSRVDTRHTPAAAPLATVMTDNVGA